MALFKRQEGDLMKYVCNVCGYVYDEAAGDPDNGIAPGTKWDDLPADFTCPLCSVGKDEFTAQD
jgi:rubredoxin